MIVVGVLVSVVFYYINYFSILFGKNETLPVAVSIWLPHVIIFLICAFVSIRLNETKIINIILNAALALILSSSFLKADAILFDSKNIKIENDGNLILSAKGTAEIPDENISIEGDKFLYNKLISELVVIGNVKFFDKLNNVFIDSEKAIYSEIENTILTNGNTFINYNNNYDIVSKNVLYNRNTSKVSSNLDTSIFDKKENIYNFKEGFLFDSINEIISSKRTNVIDSDYNEYIFERVKINLKQMRLLEKK